MEIVEKTVDLADVNKQLGRKSNSRKSLDVLFSASDKRLDQAIKKNTKLLSNSEFSSVDLALENRASNGVPLAKIRLTKTLAKKLQELQEKLAKGELQSDGISVSEVKRSKKSLLSALEPYAATAAVLRKVGATLRKNDVDPKADNLSYAWAARALTVLSLWESNYSGLKESPWEREYAKQVLKSYKKGENPRLFIFVNPSFDFRMLQTDKPELYFSTDISKSLNSQRERFVDLLEISKRLGVEFDFEIAIADRKDDAYIWPNFKVPEGLDRRLVWERKKVLRDKVEKFFVEKIGFDQTRLNVNRLSSLIGSICVGMEVLAGDWLAEGMKSAETCGLTRGDLKQEVLLMKKLWENTEIGADLYLQGLPIPDEQQLKNVALDKFNAYAREALLDITENSILIQTEKPPRLRTRMFNAGRKIFNMEIWPALYLNQPEE